MAVSYGMVAAVLVLGALGYVLDGMLDTGPWLLLTGLITGIAIGFYTLRRLMKTRNLGSPAATEYRTDGR